MSRSHNNNFDLLRLIAAIQVLIIHSHEHLKISNPYFEPLIKYFLIYIPGVPIFFVLSGFLISQSVVNNRDLLRFYFYRIIRIYPALFVCVLFTTILIFISANPIKVLGNINFYIWLLGQVTIFQYYTPEVLRAWGVGSPNGSLWTIAVELQFYLIIPFLWRGVELLKNRFYWILFFLVCSMFSIITSSFFENPSLLSKLFYVSLFPFLCWFSLGIIVFRYFDVVESWFKDKFYFWFLLYVFCVITFEGFFNFSFVNFSFKGFPDILYSLVLCGLIFSFCFSFLGLSKNVLGGNDISYGIYIFHMPLINFMIQFGLCGSFINFLLAVLSSIIAGLLSWNKIEKKILERRNILFEQIFHFKDSFLKRTSLK